MKEGSLKKEEQLKKNREYLYVYKKGKSIENRLFKIFFAPSIEKKGRIGIIISSKMCNSVKRNSLKRKTKEAFRLNKRELKERYDIIIRPKKSMICLTSKQIKAGLVKALKEISGNVIKKTAGFSNKSLSKSLIPTLPSIV